MHGTGPWWREAVFYQVYPRSFADSDGDGIGDLEGIRRRLDHLVWLGVDAIWLSPFYRSPMADFGYDVSDYCDVDPVFGTLADFDRLLADAHEHGLRVIVDWVPNHTSAQHPWFTDAASSRSSAHRDWYVWRDSAADGGPPNNWTAAFPLGTPAWTFDEHTQQWFLHLFLDSQPDLDWDNPAVESSMHDVLRFWLDRGVDGFRADVIHALAKPPALPSDPPEVAGIPHCVLNDEPATHDRVRALRRVIDGYSGDRVLVGEVYLFDLARVATYYGSGDELHLAFNIPLVHTQWDATAFAARIDQVEHSLTPRDAWPVWELSSHDEVRHRSRFDQQATAAGERPEVTAVRSEARARAAAVFTLTQRGTPFLYQGEELGLVDAVVPAGAARDPGGRDGCRAPLPWDRSVGHGWPAGDGSSGAPWLPLPPEADTRNVESQRSDETSVLHLYRRLLRARRDSDALRLGDAMSLKCDDGVLGWVRAHRDDRRLVLVNFTGAEHPRPIRDTEHHDGTWVVEIASDGKGEGQPFTDTLAPDQAVVLRPD